MLIQSPVQSNQLTGVTRFEFIFYKYITDLMLFSWKLNAFEVQLLFAYKGINVS